MDELDAFGAAHLNDMHGAARRLARLCQVAFDTATVPSEAIEGEIARIQEAYAGWIERNQREKIFVELNNDGNIGTLGG